MKISRQKLRRIIREETAGVEDVSKSSDAFGDGEVIEEPFVDVDEEDLLNVNGDPGRVRDILVIPESGGLKITRSSLKRIIREEKARLLKEQYGGGMPAESLSPLADFGAAWASLGTNVGSQMNEVVNAFIQNDREMAYEINPNALDIGVERLSRPLRMLASEGVDLADDMLEALKWAEGLFAQGEEEVEADARAAGDR